MVKHLISLSRCRCTCIFKIWSLLNDYLTCDIIIPWQDFYHNYGYHSDIKYHIYDVENIIFNASVWSSVYVVNILYIVCKLSTYLCTFMQKCKQLQTFLFDRENDEKMKNCGFHLFFTCTLLLRLLFLKGMQRKYANVFRAMLLRLVLGSKHCPT